MTKRIMNAIDVFLDAINNGTLAKGTCTACAVGNLVAHGKHLRIRNEGGFRAVDADGNGSDCASWNYAFYTCDGVQQKKPWNFDDENVIGCVEATDFTLDELMQIEFAFETNTQIPYIHYCIYSKEEVRADQIKGLAAVVKVMLTFDEQPSTDDVVNEIFTSKVELIPLN